MDTIQSLDISAEDKAIFSAATPHGCSISINEIGPAKRQITGAKAINRQPSAGFPSAASGYLTFTYRCFRQMALHNGFHLGQIVGFPWRSA